MMHTCHYTFSQAHRMYVTLRANPCVNYGLWLVVECQLRFTTCIKCATLVEDVGIVGGCAYVHVWGGRGFMGGLHLPLNFTVILQLLYLLIKFNKN